VVRRQKEWMHFPLFRKKAIISFHSRASFLISNIGCFVDGTYIKISGRARTGGKYSAPTILIDSFVIHAILIFPFIFYSIIFNEKEKLAIRTVLI